MTRCGERQNRTHDKLRVLTTETNNERTPPNNTVSISFVEGLSQGMCRIARTTGVRCAFFTPNTLCYLYTSKDRLPTDSITSAVYSVKCKTCSGEYVGETLRALLSERRNIAMRLEMGKAPSQPLPSMSMNSRCHMKSIGRA